MAARYRKIDPRMWNDEKFSELNADEKLIAIYCITAQSNRIGIFRFSPAMAIEHLGERFGQTFQERFGNVCLTLNWVFDEGRKVLFIPTWWKYNAPENPNVLIGSLSDLHEIPQTELVGRFMRNLQYLPDTFHEPFRKVVERFAQTYAKSGAGAGAGAGEVFGRAGAHPDSPENDTAPDGPKQPKQKSMGNRKPRAKAEPSGSVHHRCVKIFCDRWKAKYGTEYPFLGGRDAKHVQWLRQHLEDDPDRFGEVVQRYLDDSDPFFAKDRHSIGVLVAQFRRFITQPGPSPHNQSAIPDWEPAIPTPADLERYFPRGEKTG